MRRRSPPSADRRSSGAPSAARAPRHRLRVVSPDPAYERSVPGPGADLKPGRRYLDNGGGDLVNAGWVDYRPPAQAVPTGAASRASEDVVGSRRHRRARALRRRPREAAADRPLRGRRRRGAAATSTPSCTRRPTSRTLPVLTFMDGHRMVSLFRDRIAIAKADDIVDAWASLERLRCTVNEVWARRDADRAVVRSAPASAGPRDLQAPAGHQLQGVRRGDAARRSPGRSGAATPTRATACPCSRGTAAT